MTKKDVLVRRTFVIGIILLFIGASIVSSGEIIVEKNSKFKLLSAPIEELYGSDFKSTIWYLYCAYGGEEGLGFYAWGPGNITRFGKWDGDFFSSGSWTIDGRFICSLYQNGSLYDVDPKTLDAEFICEGPKILTISYDPITYYLYGIDDSNYLYKIDEETGEVEQIAQISGGPGYIIGSGFDIEGILYGWDLITDSLWTIDIETGWATKIGSLGIMLNYANAGDLDKIDDFIYQIACTTTCQLYRCDKTTGDCTLVGNLEGFGEISALAISYELNMIPPVTNIYFDPPIYKNLYSDNVTVTLNATDNTGVIDTFYRLNGEEWITYESPFNISKNGGYNIEYYSYDYVGNIEEIKVYYYPYNNPPYPTVITGPSRGKPKTVLVYNFSSVDPDGHYISAYIIDWGDGLSEHHYGHYESGKEITVSHAWPQKDIYIIKAKAIDEYGSESNWSSFELTIPKTREIFFSLLNHMMERFPIIEKLIYFLM